ncbi:hypothetical protein [Streptomyces sp. NBC_01235]|uniref:hypothetical protein n=1 Tax=Streptomyces sp. NBC_01235 TaxID=2903788 RepID=UPI002E0DB863|nr:hypothetical protein OG289_19075 [Streptomyces sp. NBC_01235]
MTGAAGCDGEEKVPVPKESQVVGSWSNPGGDWITFRKGGTGLISAGAQLQLSELMDKSETTGSCEFSWGVDTVPAGGDKWVSVTFEKGQCGSAPGEFGLYYYYEDSKELRLSPAVEFPEPGEIYSRSNAR